MSTHIIDFASGLLAFSGAGGSVERRVLQADDAVVLRSYSERYAVLRRQKDPTPLLGLGRDLFNWLNGSQKWLERSLGNVSGEIQIDGISAAVAAAFSSRRKSPSSRVCSRM